jgi:hypothetical protein
MTEIGIMVRRQAYWQLPIKYLCLFLILYLFYTIIPEFLWRDGTYSLEYSVSGRDLSRELSHRTKGRVMRV